MSHRQHVPLRTCMGCGERASQQTLLRTGLATDALVLVGPSNRPGRTGYLHKNQDCWRRFAARKGLVRSLGRSISRQDRVVFVEQLTRCGWAPR